MVPVPSADGGADDGRGGRDALPRHRFCRPVVRDALAGKLADHGFNVIVMVGTIYVVAAAYFSLLIVVGRWCESIIRRREARKP